jgi:DUF1009 family protein
VIACEAGRTLLLDRDAVLAQAERWSIALVAVDGTTL